MDIRVFQNQQFGSVRTLGSGKNPLFCLADVCRVLALDPSQVARRLEKGVLSKHTLQTPGGPQEMNFVNEDGLYDVLLDSRKPEAKKFRKWITAEVLPAIRKTGFYNLPKSRELQVAEALITAKELIDECKAKIAELEPKAKIYDVAMATGDALSWRELCKIIYDTTGVNENELHKILVENRWIYKKRHYSGKSYYLPFSEILKKGLMITKEVMVQGRARVSNYFTSKGRDALIELIAPAKLMY